MSNKLFVKLCGLSSIIATIAYIGTVVFSLVAGLSKPDDIAAMSQFLQDWYDVKGIMTAYGWFGILGSLFTLPAILGYYQILRKEGPMQWIPAAIIFHGVVLLTLAYIIPLVISHSLAPIAATESNVQVLNSIYVTVFMLRKLEDIFIIVGTILTVATGIAIIGLIDLKESILPLWVNILGIVTGVLSFGLIGTLGTGVVFTIFNIVTIIDLSLMLIWMVIVGILMLIKKEYYE